MNHNGHTVLEMPKAEAKLTTRKISQSTWQHFHDDIQALRRKTHEDGTWYGGAAHEVVPLIYQEYLKEGVVLNSFVKDVVSNLTNLRPSEVVGICVGKNLTLPINLSMLSDDMAEEDVLKLFTSNAGV